MYSNSKVVFRETPGITDLLDLFIGRVKVFIEHSKGPNPKDVEAPTAVISVRGTVFDVEVQDEDGTTFVTLDDGLVDVRNLTAPGPSVLLKPGDSILIEPNKPLIPQQINQHAALRLVLKAAGAGSLPDLPIINPIVGPDMTVHGSDVQNHASGGLQILECRFGQAKDRIKAHIDVIIPILVRDRFP